MWWYGVGWWGQVEEEILVGIRRLVAMRDWVDGLVLVDMVTGFRAGERGSS